MNAEIGTTIPLLPSAAIEETVEFWQAIGFETTYRQRSPSSYVAMKHGTYELHFYGLSSLKPQDNFTMCIVNVPEVENLHRRFSERIRTLLGKVPTRGFPRISRMRPGQTRFTVTDTAGNSVYFIKAGDEDHVIGEAYKKADQTEWQRTLNMVARLRDYHLDDAKAAKVLDVALARTDPDGSSDYAYALAARIDLAVAMEDIDLVPDLLTRLTNMPLSAEDREELRHEFTVLNELGF